MASDLIEAVFDAKDEMTDTLSKIDKVMSKTGNQAQDLGRDVREIAVDSDVAEEQFQGLATATGELIGATENAQDSIDRMSRAINGVVNGSYSAREAANILEEELENLRDAGVQVDESLDRVGEEMGDLSSNAGLSNKFVASLNKTLGNLRLNTDAAEGGVEELVQAFLKEAGAATTAKVANESAAESLDDVSEQAQDAARDLGILASVAQATSFSMANLSVNIGPFNVALRSILVQLPAILTGMGALLAIITSLATAFLVAAGGLAAFIAGGAIAFFDDFSQQFEDSAQAVEALMSALRDLFTKAMEPLMTDANMELFIDSINTAARLVNRFAQFFNQMRGDIMSFLRSLEGDLPSFLEALHDSFNIIEPILRNFTNWFLNTLPSALVFFSEVTRDLAGSLGILVDTFGKLFNQLLIFSAIVLESVAPVIAGLVWIITTLVSVVNALPDVLVTATLSALAFTAAGWKLAGVASTMVEIYGILSTAVLRYRKAIFGATIALRTNTAATIRNIQTKITSIPVFGAVASAIGTLILALTGETAATIAATAATEGLIAALSTLLPVLIPLFVLGASLAWVFLNWDKVMGMVSGSTSILGDAVAFLGTMLRKWTLPAVNLLISYLKFLFAPILGLIKAFKIYADVLGDIVSGGEGIAGLFGFLADIFKTVADAAGAVMTGFRVIFDILSAIIQAPFILWAKAIAIAIREAAKFVVGLINAFMGLMKVSGVLRVINEVFDAINEQIDNAIAGVKEFIRWLNMIPGVNIDGPTFKEVKGDVERTSTEEDDIETQSNVNLNFRDEINNNVDVDADPEEKEQLRRLVKDALNEANSVARRQQGHPG